ncbi:MAG: hypothetical protein FJ128_09530 [Deltaproteobacteria bacterium]|nr:hypothetical protein [Deltaproteobacteria bacterium]
MSPAPRFRFSLETVLKVRTLREELARWELARANQELERCRRALADTQRRRAEAMAELSAPAHRDWQGWEFQLYCLYLEQLASAIVGWQERLIQEEERVAEKQRTLELLHQERRLLERLREKHFALFRREVAKTWERECESISLGRWDTARRRHEDH